jgi:hypothetical protein
MHITVTDKNGNVVPGVGAYYGFAFVTDPDPTNFNKSTADWELWGLQKGQVVVDSKARDPGFSGDPAVDFSWEPGDE